MAIAPVSAQNTSAITLQNQEQQLLNQIKTLQKNDPKGNAAQIQVLQRKYKALLLQQQQRTQAVTAQPQQEAQSVPSSSTTAGKGINIKA